MLNLTMVEAAFLLLLNIVYVLGKLSGGCTTTRQIKQTKLSAQQQDLIRRLETTKDHLFITGKAGSGKSTVLNEFKQQTKLKVVVTAPTGIAALNVNGQTLHSLFNFSLGLNLNNAELKSSTKLLLTRLDVLIIDEISMVRADVIDAIDARLRQARCSRVAFGGVRLIMFGDLYQLPPVVSSQSLRSYLYEKYGGIYFFNARVWRETSLKIYELNNIFRQTDDHFKNILNEIRQGIISPDSLRALNKRVKAPPDASNTITLTSTNKLVQQINDTNLSNLPGKEYVYKAINYKGSGLTDVIGQNLRLKVGAKVIFTKNDSRQRWVNGSLGEVKSLKRGIKVKVGGSTYRVDLVNYSKIEYCFDPETNTIKEKTVSETGQYPLKLAWAVTIHKSQGQTYSSCQIDLREGVFSNGQAYVALSRCVSLEGLYLSSPIMSSDISADPKIIEFMKRAKVLSAQ